MANNMGNALIDKVIQVCGSPAEAARRLGVSRVVVHEVQHGKKQMSPELAVLCAELIGADPYREAAVAMVANCKDPEKAERLNRAFHLPRLAGGVAMLLIFVIGGLVPGDNVSAKSISQQLTGYTSWQLCRRIVRFFVLMARETIGATVKPGTRTIDQAGHRHCGLKWL